MFSSWCIARTECSLKITRGPPIASGGTLRYLRWVDWDWIGPAMDVRPFFAVERRGLLELLPSLDAADWRRQTACPGWSVHDIVAHITHDHLRRLSGLRDRHVSGGFETGEDLPAFLTRVNQEFVDAARRWSPVVLMDLLAHLGPQLDDVWSGLDLNSTAAVDVWWAEPGVPAPTWLDVARELSELWIHQQQVRDAVHRAGPDSDELVGAIVDTLIRGLPLTLSTYPATPGTRVRMQVTGQASRTWLAHRDQERWLLQRADEDTESDATVQLSADTLWRLGSRGISPQVAATRAAIDGDPQLGHAALRLLAVIR